MTTAGSAMQGRRLRRQGGFSLIELMIAMMLGLLVVGAAIGIFLSNRRAYQATEGVGRVQEGVRTAFELMSRDVREAAGNPCVNNLPIANVLNNPAASWWSNLTVWGDAFRGFVADEDMTDLTIGGDAGQRVAGTQAVQLFTADDNVATISAHDTGTYKFTLNTTTSGIATGDIVMACNARQASIFQVSAASGDEVFHGTSGTPGNCATGLGIPMECGTGTTFAYTAPNSVLVRVHATRWYIGNGTNGPALYQQVATGNGTVTTQEVADGVTNLSVLYLVSGQTAYQAADAVADWSTVTSARITLSLAGTDKVGANDEVIERQLIHVVSLRNRNP